MSFLPDNPNFADILDDDIICNSQPISLPSENSDKEELNFNDHNPAQLRPPKRTGQQGEFRSTEEIDPKYRHIFTYPYFNLVQSRVIEDALYTDKSMVVCAPTGSGKTVVFEMAIAQLLMDIEDRNYTGDFKIIYMAPVKALCTERLTEWYPKLTKLGLLCIEVTGDTDVEYPHLKPYSVIITTPEKWDMLTRRWRDHKGLVEVVKLFLIDEVHILNDNVRGPVLEAVVSRMKTIESSVQSAHRIEQLQRQYENNQQNKDVTTPAPRIRFVAASATVNNPEDVAAWLGTSEKPAVFYKFGDECRPVKLKRVVEGYPCPEGTSIFKFDIILNYKLWPIIQKYHDGKPTLIFCNTRKSVALTAEALSREITITFNPEQKAKLAALASTIKNKKLQTLILNGVGCHHAGLLFEERMNIEYAFRNRDLPILITTTTLAMGVNLPAHLVIIKNTQQYVNGAYQEYSISTILQMVGRAGRPQFDTEATAVIMTRMADKARYQALVGGTEPLQSFLHKRLAENLNSEAALGTITDVAQCVQWLNSTFLSVRAAKDPKRYLGLPPSAPTNQISKKIEELCVIAMNGLASSGLITMDEASCIESTEAGKLMSVYYIDLETMKLIMKIDGSETLERLLWLVCECHELSDMHLRVDERRCLNALNRSNTSATIRFPMKGKINSRQMKLYCVIQAVLGCLPIPDPSLNQEAMKIMRIADRVCKCLVAYTTRPSSIYQQSRTFSAVLNAIILAKCIAVHLWENSPYVSKQLRGIGPTFSMLLASAGKVNFMLLEESHPRDLERIMNKGPPAGNMIRKQISLLPKYQITISPIDGTRVQIQVSLLNQAHLLENIQHLTAGTNHKSYIIVGDSENCLLYLNSFKDTDLIRVYDGCITCEVTRKHNHEHKIMAYCISSSFVGIDVQSDYLFMDLEPTYNLRADYVPNMCDNVSKAVTNINFPDSSKSTDRKRKIIDTAEVTCSKEKIKRENNLLEKFKYLKESFSKTSKSLMGNFNKKTTEMSNKIRQNLTASESKNDDGKRTEFALTKDISDLDPAKEQHTAPIECQSVITSTVRNLSPTEDLFENLEDDDQVNNILQEIEDEIGKNAEQRKVLHTNLCSTLPITCQSNNKQNKVEKQHKKIKSNFNFINKLESEDNVFEDNINDDVGGFAETVKVQIDKYLQNVVKVKSPVINYEEFLDTIHKDYADVVQINGTDNKLLNTIENTNETSVTENKCDPLHEQLGIGQNFKTNQKDDENKEDCEQINLSEQQNDHPIKFISDIESSSKILSKLKSPCLQKDTVQNTYPDLSKKEISQQSKQVISIKVEYNTNDNDKHDKNQNEINNNLSSQIINSLCTKNHKQIKDKTVRDDNIGINSSRLTELSIPITYNHESTIMSEDVHIFSNPQNTNTTADLAQEKTRRIENYSFRATKFVMSQQRNIKQTIQIIKKLKIGLDVTKITSTNEDTGKDNSNVPFINVNNPGCPEKSVINEIDSIDFDIQLEPEFNEILDVIDNVQLHDNRGNKNIEPETESKNQDDPYPLLQKNSDVQTTPKINTARTPEPEDNLPNLSKCNNVKDLIRKYSSIMERSKTPSAPVTKPVSLKNVTKPHVQQPVEKPKRRYKINEIQNLEIDFPKMPIADSRELDPNEQERLITKRKDTNDIYLNSRISENFKDVPEYQIHVCNEPTQTDICNEIKTDLEFNLETHSPQIKGVFQPEFINETCNIKYNTLLNPKTLLKCFDNKTAYVDDEVIPPPPEYADVLAVSPTQSKTNVTNAYTPASPDYYSEMDHYDRININPDYTEPAENIFDDYNEGVRLTTPTGTIETWTLSHEDCIPENKTHSFRSFTIMRNNSINKLSPYDARNMKLNKFKLVKNLPKLKKK